MVKAIEYNWFCMEGEEPPPMDAPIEELEDYWKEETTITVRRMTKRRLDEHRDGRSWDVFLEKLRREHSDPLTINDVERLSEMLAEKREDGEFVEVDFDTDQLDSIESTTVALEQRIGTVESLLEDLKRTVE